MKKTIIFSLFLFALLQQAAFARPKLVKTTITSTPSGATVYINGGNYVNEAYRTPTTQNLYQGMEYSLTFVLNGYETKTIKYVGGTGTVKVTLSKPGSTTSDDPTITEVDDDDDDDDERWVKASITSDPNARLVIDGGNYNNESFTTPVQLNFYDGQRYSMTFSKSGYVTQQVTFYGGQRNLHVSLEQEIINYDINIDSNVRGAKVYIDGNYVGETRCQVQLEEGQHSIKVSKNGYNTYTSSFNVTRNDSLYIELDELKYLKLTLPSGAKLWVDGKQVKLNFRNNSRRTFKIDADGRERVKIKIQYYGLVVEDYITFDKQTIQLQLLLTQ